MSGKKWLCFFALSLLLSVLGIEATYRFHDYSRTEVDYVVKHKLGTLHGEAFDTVILGDSLAHHAFGSLMLRDNILDLTTNASISIAGNYFLLKKYLKRNKKPENVYLFATSYLFYNNLDNKQTYLYFETVFTDEDQIKEIKKIKPFLFSSKFSIDKFIEKRRNSFLIFNHYYPSSRVKGTVVKEKELSIVTPFINDKIIKKVKSMRDSEELLYDVPKTYIRKLSDLCQNEKINLILVIEPEINAINEMFKKSKMHRYLINENINIIDINDYYNFANYFFRYDGVHLEKKANFFYQGLIDKYVLNIYSDATLPN